MFDIVLITGAAGTGKTSTAHAWAASRQHVAAHLSHDNVLLFTKSGLASPAAQVTSEAERQWRVALKICCAAAALYAQHQIPCAIDTFLLPEHVALWRELLPYRVGLVVLHPPLDVAIARNAARLEQTGWGVPEWQVRANHNAMSAWQHDERPLVLDTGEASIPQVVAAIDAWEGQSEPRKLF